MLLNQLLLVHKLSTALLENVTAHRLVKKCTRILWNPKVYYRFHKSPPRFPMISQANHAHALPIDFLKIHFNITLPTTPRSSKWSLSFGFPHQKRACPCLSPRVCYMPFPRHSASDHRGSSTKYFGKSRSLWKRNSTHIKC